VDIVHGTISGSKFLDLDGDGLQDADESNLGDWTINLFRDSNANGTFESGTDPQVATTDTDSDGNFTFSNLVPGTYFVREAVVAGFTQTTANPGAVVITADENSTGLVFGNEPPTTSIIADPCDNTKTALLIIGTGGDDSVKISQGKSLEIVVKSGKTTLGTFSPTGRIIAYGLGGNDQFKVKATLSLPLIVRGGDGNDVIFGTNHDDILIGGDGDDRITGRRGRDILIGGSGADRMLGSRDEDIMVAGTTDYDNNDQALCAILDEWTNTSRDYPTRVSNIRGTGAGPRENEDFFLSATLGTVDDDSVTDRLTGGGDGLDWFIAQLTGGAADKLADKAPAEFVDEL
jgi:Ca2+-binding RTX toxin-like protein